MLTRRRRLLLRLTFQILGAQVMAIATLALLAWLLGRLINDRCLFGQWLLWIPTPVMLPVVVLGLLACLAPARRPLWRRRRLHAWIAITLAIAAYFCFIEHRLLRPPPPGRGLTASHWVMTHGRTHDQRDQHVAFVHEILSDVTILVEAWALARSDALLESLPRDYTVIHQNPFTVLTRLPVIEARPLVSHEHSRIALLILDATEMLGRDLVIYAIDLPSNPRMSRANLTAEVRQFLEDADAPPPDLVIGDCNMTRPSASLGALFPAMHHAFTDGGHGYAASYHRAFPLYHIDHVLLTDDLRSPRYDLLDPGFGRHLAQRAWIADALTE